jgi:hypothetical protein
MRDNSILFVAGDEDVQRHVYDTYEFGYWSAGFDAILEKNGFLDVETATQDVLAEPETLRQYDVVLVAWLPDDFWKEEYVDSVQAHDGLLFIEGPFPESLHEVLGVTEVSGGSIAEGRLEFEDEDLGSYVTETFDQVLSGKNNLPLAPKRVATKAASQSKQLFWDGLEVGEEIGFTNLCEAVSKSFTFAYKQRVGADNFFSNNRRNLALAWFLDEFDEKGGTIEAEDDVEVLLEWVLDYADTEPDERGERIVVDQLKGSDAVAARMQAGAEAGRTTALTVDSTTTLLTAALLVSETGDSRLREACEAYLSDRVTPNNGRVDVEADTPVTLEDLFQFVIAASVIGHDALSKAILREVLELSFDSSEGNFENIKIVDGEVERLETYFVLPWAPLACLQHVDTVTADDRTADVLRAEYDDDRVDRWGNQPFRVHRYRPTSAESLASVVTDEGDEYAGVFAQEDIVGVPFQLFAYIVHYHTMRPLDEAFQDCPAESLMALQGLFEYLLTREAAERDADLLTVDAWPWGADYCVTVRHDVDRIPTEETMQRLLSLERSEGLGVSWFWIHDRLAPEYMTRVESLGHEIGLHAMKHRQKTAEIRTIEAACDSSIDGECLHGGGGGGDFWLGHPTIRAAEEAGLTYTEGMSTIYDYPHSFPVLEADGTISFEDVVSLSHTMTVDTGVTRQGANVRDSELLLEYVENGFYVVVLNHPDMSFERLEGFVSTLPDEGRLDWTCAEVTDWWRRTHRRESLSVEHVEDDDGETAYRLTAEEDVTDLEVRLPAVQGRHVVATVGGDSFTPEQELFTAEKTGQERLRLRLDLETGRTVELAYVSDTDSSDDQRWRDYLPGWGQ